MSHRSGPVRHPLLDVLQPVPSGAIPARFRLAFVALPGAALALVAGLDALPLNYGSAHLVGAMLDEPAHLATAWLFLAAFLPRRARAWEAWALVASVAMDLDHVPLYLWHVLASGPGAARPVTHSLATLVVLTGGAALASPRLRVPILGLALGVGLHFIRDLATGAGLPLLWPVDSAGVALPYSAYLAALVLVTVVASARRAVLARQTTDEHHLLSEPAPTAQEPWR